MMPLEEEVRKLRKENEELGQQVTLMVEEGERKEVSVAGTARGGGGNMMDYDTMMKRMEELQDTRVTMEEELRQLRQERSSILQENASLREGSQPQVYANLKLNYENVINHLRETEMALNERKKLCTELQSANSDLHQKLVMATDPELLKSVQDRMVRYKNERDAAKKELEDKQVQVLTAEMLQHQLDSKDEEMAQLQKDLQRYETKMKAYRSERNSLREQAKRQHAKEAQEFHITPKLEGAELDELNIEQDSPSHEHPPHQYGSPTLDYTPGQYSHHQQYQRDSHTPEDGATSPTYKYRSKMTSSDMYSSQAKPKAESCMYSTISVLTKEGMADMEVQKPSAQLNAKHRPQVVVKRDVGQYETGTLMYVGRVGGKEIAGVQLDTRIQSECCYYN